MTDMGRSVTNVGDDKKSTQPELKKHAATIHCSNTLSLLQRKISNALLYHAYQELMVKEEHEITIKQLCKLIAYQGHNHAAIKEALKELLSTVIEWNLIDDKTGVEDWTASTIIASVSLQGPMCYYAYSPRMKQLLHSPSMFGKINLVIQSRFRSSYGLALYENCSRYRGLPHTKWFEMDIFKKLMGVPPGKYDIFRDFKRRVLDKSIDEVNAHSDIVVKPEFQREGRRTVRLRFLLKEREKKSRLGTPEFKVEQTEALEGNLEKPSDQLKMVLMTKFALTHPQAEQVIAEYGAEFILEKIAVVESSTNFRQGRIRNTAGYFISALKNNYQLPKSTLSELQIKRQQDNDNLSELTQLRRLIEEIQKEYTTYREKTIDECIQALSQAEQQEFFCCFHQFAAPAIQTILRLQHNKYTVETVIHSPQIKALLRQYAMRELDSLNLLSLEEFAAQLPSAKKEAWQKLKSRDPDHPLLRYANEE